MKPRPARRWARAMVAAGLVALLGCGDGTVTFGGGDDDDDETSTVTVKGNIDDVTPVTGRNIVVFAYNIPDANDDDRCPCPAQPDRDDPGKAAVLASGETEFTLSGLDSGPLGVVFLLDKAGDAADGQIDEGDPIAILEDVDCEIDDVESNLTVTLNDVDISFPEEGESPDDCAGGNPPADGRARADEITKVRTANSD